MKNSVLLGAVCTVLLCPVTAMAVTIDSFSGEQRATDVPLASGIPPSESELDGISVLGGSRDIDAINTLGNPGGTTAEADEAGSGVFEFSNESGNSGTAVLTYDGNDDAPSAGDVDIDGLGFISIIEGTNSFFAFDVIFNDFPIEYKITVWDLDSADTVTGLIESGTGGSGPNNGTNPEIVYFSAFTGINFAMVGAIQLEFTGGNSADLSIDNFRTEGETPPADVPLPASSVLLLGALFGLGRYATRPRAS